MLTTSLGDVVAKMVEEAVASLPGSVLFPMPAAASLTGLVKLPTGREEAVSVGIAVVLPAALVEFSVDGNVELPIVKDVVFTGRGVTFPSKPAVRFESGRLSKNSMIRSVVV